MSLVALLVVLGVGLGAYAAFGADAVATPVIASGPANPTNATSASFSFTDSTKNVIFECRVDAGVYGACTSPKAYPAGTFAAGAHQFQVRARSGSSTSSAASYSWVVDLTPPVAPGFSSKPSDPSEIRSPSFGFTATESGESFLCSLDGAAFTPCANPVSHSNLAIGSHTFAVKGKDAAGNVSSTASSYGWRIVPPAPTITAKPANPTAQTTASFSFSDTVSGATFVCSLDGSAFTACSSPKSYGPLSEATHTFQVKAVSNGQQSAASSHNWRVDVSPPVITVTFPNNGGTYNATSWNAGCSGGAGICGSATDPSGVAGAAVSIQQQATGKWWNGTAFANSSETLNAVTQVSVTVTTFSGRYPLAVPPNGSYLVHVRAADTLGNTNTAASQTSLTFTIGTVGPPAPTITHGPANPTTSDSASFTFTDLQAGVSFQCKLDTGSYAVCTSGITYTGLSNAAHTFSVQAKDGAGNLSSPASFPWTINNGAPFTVHGSVTNLLIGVEQSVPVKIDNPNDVAIYVSEIDVTLTTNGGSGTCGASNFTTTNWIAATAAAKLMVPAGATNFAVPAADQPKIKLNDLPSNQDVCKSKTFTLSFGGSAGDH